MFRGFLHQSFSVFLAGLIMFSTLSFTVNKHFCGTDLVDISLFTNTDKCGDKNECIDEADCKKKKCCKDETELIKSKSDLKYVAFENLKFDQHYFLLTFYNTYSTLFESLPQQTIPFKEYSPPNLIFDIHLLDQVFII